MTEERKVSTPGKADEKEHEKESLKINNEFNFQRTVVVLLMFVIVLGLVLPYFGSWEKAELKVTDSTATLTQLLIQILSAAFAYTLGKNDASRQNNNQPAGKLNPPFTNPTQPGYPPQQPYGGQPGYPPQQPYGGQPGYPSQQSYVPQGQYVAPNFVNTPGALQPPFANPNNPTPTPTPPTTARPPIDGGRG